MALDLTLAAVVDGLVLRRRPLGLLGAFRRTLACPGQLLATPELRA